MRSVGRWLSSTPQYGHSAAKSCSSLPAASDPQAVACVARLQATELFVSPAVEPSECLRLSFTWSHGAREPREVFALSTSVAAGGVEAGIP
jgi:hypothetical protein